MDAGMDDFVAKPIEPGDLWEALLRWIRPRRAARAERVLAAPGAADPALPEAIEGLDVASGLRFVMEKRDLYLKLIERFVSGQRDFEAAIRRALDAGDQEGAERRAHNLKGSAATLGASGISSLAAELEGALRREEAAPHIEARLAALMLPLATLIEALEAWRAAQADAAATR